MIRQYISVHQIDNTTVSLLLYSYVSDCSVKKQLKPPNSTIL